MKRILVFLLLTIYCFTGFAQQKRVSAYYPDWSIYTRKYPPSKIPVNKLDQIISAFVFPFVVDGTLTLGDPVTYRGGAAQKGIIGAFTNFVNDNGVAQTTGLAFVDVWADFQITSITPLVLNSAPTFLAGTTNKEQINNWISTPDRNKQGVLGQLINLRLNTPRLRLVTSVGGWTLAQQFPIIANDINCRAAFASACGNFCTSFKLDGMDFDWEFPVAGGTDGTETIDGNAVPAQNHNIHDPENFVMLAKAVKAVLKPLNIDFTIALAQDPHNVGDKYIFANNKQKWASSIYKGYDGSSLVDWIDYFATMTYDYGGAWLSTTSHQAPLYDSKVAGDPDFNMSVSSYMDKLLSLGVPAARVYMGVPFYGRGWGGVNSPGPNANGMYQPASNTNKLVGSWDDPAATSEYSASFDYGDLKDGKAKTAHQYIKDGVGTGNNGFIEYWDDSTKVPFVYNSTTGQLISYDNPRSITAKVQYAMSKNLAGVFTWEITQDDAANSMATAMYDNAQSYNISISGKIKDASGTGIPSVNISLTDGTNTIPTISDASGVYSYTVPALRNYTLTFTKSTYTFLPSSRTFSTIQKDTVVAVVGSNSAYTLGGNVNFTDGSALTGISINLNSGTSNLQNTITSTGAYSFTNIPGGSFQYTVQPISNFYTFNPVNYTHASLNANQASDNFVATYKTYTISGHVSSKSGGSISGQTIALSSTITTKSVVTDASGNFSFSNLQAMVDYTISPQIVNNYLLPGSIVVKSLGKDSALVIAEPAEIAIFGYVKNGAAALPNVLVSMTNDWQAAWNYGNSRTTDANGFYVFDLPASATQLTNFTLKPGAGTYFPANYTSASLTTSLKANFNTQTATITMALTQPADTVYVDANNHILISSTASTDVGTITGVTYAVDGQSLPATNTSSNIYQATWTPSALKTKYTLIVTATNSGGVTSSVTKSVYVGCLSNCPNTKPLIVLNAPLASSEAQKTFTPVSVAANITDDGTVASVQFIIDGTTYTPTLSGSTYTYSFTPTAYKSYSIVINATDNNGLVGTLNKTYLINQPSTFTPLPTPAIVGYWQNWMSGTAPLIKLKDLVSSNYNVIDVAFGVQQSSNQAYLPMFTPDPSSYPDVQVFKDEIKLLKNAGKPVVLSLGGETGQFIIQSVEEKVAFRNAIINIVDTYGFDGIDIDFEGAAAKFGETSTSLLYNTLTSTRSKLLIDVLKELKTYYGSSFLLTMAPELAYVQGGMVGYPAPAQGDFLPILYNLQNEIDLLQIQYYNYGSEWWTGAASAQAPKSAELIIHEVEILLAGFKLGGTTNYFPAIPASKLAIGMPATCSAAGPDYNVNIDSLIKGLEYLRTGVKPDGFKYTLQGGPYPPIRGMMTWSINWDATTDCSHVPYDFANKYYAYFKRVSNQAPVVTITAPANNAVLNTGANNITVSATDADGSVVGVDFYLNGTKIGSDATAPYSFSWNAISAGSYQLKAIATDNNGLAGNSAITTVQVVVAGSPTITLTAPANNAQIMPGTTLILSANAVPSSGSTITKVDFYEGANLVNTDLSSPYTYTWSTATPGTHYITAKATDNSNRTALSTIDTIAVFVNYPISGTIAKADNTAIAGVTVTLTGNNQTITATTDANGNYSFISALSGSSYTITPTATGMIFTPQTNTITNIANATTVNFTLNEGVFFQGTVLDGKIAKPGIYLYVTDATSWWTTPDIITDASGYYKLLIPADRIGHNFTLELRSWQTWDNSAAVQFDRTLYSVTGYTLNSGYQISLPAFTKAATMNFNTSHNTIDVAIVTPAQISAAKNSAIVLQATATIQTGTISTVSFVINGQTIAGTFVSGTTYQASWTPSAVDTTYSLVVTASGQGIQGTATKSITVNCTGVGCANKPPVIVLSTPVNTSERQVSFTAVPITAQITDADGTVSSVVYKIDGVNYTPVNNGSSYTYSFTPTAYKIYPIVITVTDNSGAVTILNKSYEITAPTPFTPAPSKVVVGYWHNWENSSAPFMPLINVKNTKYNVCVVTFIETLNSDGYTALFAPLSTRYPDPSVFISEVKALKAAGIPVLISIGGQNGHMELSTLAKKAAFRDSIIAIVDRYGFDGLDLDFEGGSMNYGETVTSSLDYANLASAKLKYTIDFVREVKAHYGNGFMITAAPEVFYVQVGKEVYSGGLPGAFLPVIHNIRTILDYVAVQLYNTGSVTATDGKAYNQASPNFLVSMSDMLLNNFTMGTSGTVFPALRQDQVVIGIPSTPSSAPAGGYLNTTKGIMALDYLMKGTKDASITYTTQSGPYPNLRGVMTWSINWDASTDAGITPYTFANTYSNYFNGIVAQIPVVNVTAPASSTILNIGSNTITVAATDADGTIASVDFYINGLKVGTDVTAPYTYNWTSTAAGPYQLQANATDNSGLIGNSTVINVQVIQPKALVNAKVFLQGDMPGSGIIMRSDLQNYFGSGSGLLPVESPYVGGLDHTYSAISNTSGVAGVVVDWIKVEVRLASDNYATVVETKSLLLKPDGSIVNTLGVTPSFNQQTGTARLVIKHRNHMAIMSNDITSFAGTVNYDFSTALSKASNQYGDPAQMKLVNGVYTMIHGDVFTDLYIDAVDASIFKIAFLLANFDTYLVGDLNMDGLVDPVDAALFKQSFLQAYYSTLTNY